MNNCPSWCVQCQIIYPRLQLFTIYELETMGFATSELLEHSLKLRNIAGWVANPVNWQDVKSPSQLVITFTETARGSCFAWLFQKKQRSEWKSAQEITLSSPCPLYKGKHLITLVLIQKMRNEMDIFFSNVFSLCADTISNTWKVLGGIVPNSG